MDDDMDRLSNKLQAQLDSAHLAIDALNRDRERLRVSLAQATAQAEASQPSAVGESDEVRSLIEQLQAREVSVAALTQAIAERDAAFKFVVEEFANQYLSETGLREQLRRAQQVVEQIGHEKDAERDALEARLGEQLREANFAVERLGGEKDAVFNTLVAVYASHSWKLTRPVRGFSRALRFMGRLPGRAVRFAKRSARSALSKFRRASYRALSASGNAVLDTYTRAARFLRMRFGSPRTLWGVTPILTLPVLAQCDRLLGLKSQTLVFTTYYITENFDINLKRLCEFVYKKYPFWGVRLHKVVFRIALARYDVYHYFMDRGILLPNRRIEINEDEMRAITRFGHKLYTYTYGADVRTRQVTLGLGKYNYCADCPEPMKFCTCDDAAGEGNVQRISQYATAMLALGDMVHYVPGCRNFHFWPLDLSKVAYVGSAWSGDRPLRIAHAPNHSHFKGSRHLIAAIDRLVAEGRPIELVSVSGVPNHEVLKLFAGCDVIADQFIGGLPGYTAMEAMAIGKPVLCYLRDETMVIDAARCPIINTWPDTVYDILKACLDGEFDLTELGRRSRNYVEYYYSLEGVASRLGELYIETAGFPDRINRRLAKNIAGLKAKLPPLIDAEPPVPWSATRLIDQGDAETKIVA